MRLQAPGMFAPQQLDLQPLQVVIVYRLGITMKK